MHKINSMSNFRQQPWFHSLDMDEHHRFIVKVHQMNEQILKMIPDKIDREQVLIHFHHEKNMWKTEIDLTDEPRVNRKDKLGLIPIELQDLKDQLISRLRFSPRVVVSMINRIEANVFDKTDPIFKEVVEELMPHYEKFGYDVLVDLFS